MSFKEKTAVIAMIGIICMLTFMGCQKSSEKESTSDAVITGYDLRDCVCCGGLMINFNNNAVPYSGDFNLINELPVNSGIGNNSKFPIYVKVTWKYSTMVCSSTKFVDILKLEIK